MGEHERVPGEPGAALPRHRPPNWGICLRHATGGALLTTFLTSPSNKAHCSFPAERRHNKNDGRKLKASWG